MSALRRVVGVRRLLSDLGMTRLGSAALTGLLVVAGLSIASLWVEFSIGKNWDAEIEAAVVIFFTTVAAVGMFAVDRLCQWLARLWRSTAL